MIVIEPLLTYTPVSVPRVMVLPGAAVTVWPGATGPTVAELRVCIVALVEASCRVARVVLPVARATVWA